MADSLMKVQNATLLVIDFDGGESFVMRGNSITQNGLLQTDDLATVKELLYPLAVRHR